MVKLAESEPKIFDDYSIASVPIWSEKDRNDISRQLSSYSEIVSIEEHLLAGGFGSFLLECGLPCKPICLDSEVCGAVGTQSFLRENFGLSRDRILSAIKG